MVPDKFNMVDMEGIDIITSQGEEIPGLYQKLVESITQCRYQCIYNWKFDGILIPPTYVEMTIVDDVVWINEGVSVDEEDVIRIYSLEPPAPEPRLLALAVSANGDYLPPADYDGFSSVNVSVPEPVFDFLQVTANGTYYPPQGVDGFGAVEVDVPSSGQMSANLSSYLSYLPYGAEYPGYIYDTSKIEECNLVLLADTSQTSASSVELLHSINNYTAIVLQGVYQTNRKSQYNTTSLYIQPQLNHAYWAGMKDRNSSYTCHVTFTDATHATLTGNKQVLIYGMP